MAGQDNGPDGSWPELGGNFAEDPAARKAAASTSRIWQGQDNPAQPRQQQPYAQPQQPYGQQTESSAVVALVLAIASYLFCPVLPAIAALFVAGGAAGRIRASGGRLGGSGLVTAARVVAIVHLVLVVVGTIAFVAFAVTGTRAGGGATTYG